MEITTTQETLSPQPDKYEISFKGNGGEYFTIVIVNWLLTVITLGLYYPWAKARNLQYMYSATEFNNVPFVFHGTGKEMFKGFIKALLLLVIIYGLFLMLIRFEMLVTGILFFYVAILSIVPLAIHGSYRYRMSRTTWSGIRMGYRGDKKTFYGLCMKGFFLTVITLGIYSPWLIISMRNYLLSNVRLGSLKFKYFGRGVDYFVINLKGYFLTIITLGVFFFWWQKEKFEYYVNNLSLNDEVTGGKLTLKNKATGGQFAGFIIINLLLFVVTLGLAYPWIVCRTMEFIFSNVEIAGDINTKTIAQTESDYRDATGEDLTDILDFDFVI